MTRSTAPFRRGSCAAVLLCAVLASLGISCEVGPNYKRPPLPVSANFKSATTQESENTPRLAANWWQLFGDKDLNDLEEAAVLANNDIHAAMARVVESRAAARIVKSQFFPVITADPSISRSRGASHGTSGSSSTQPSGGSSGVSALTTGGATVSTQTQVPFDLSYEVDLWGQIRRGYESAVATARASAHDYEVVLQTLEADVAQDYFAIRSFDSQDKILRGTVESYRKQVELTHQQLKAGLVSQLDMVQAEAQLDATITQLIENERQRVDMEHALAILLGRPPAELTVAVRELTLTPPVIPVGLPAALLRRRPDVLEAEQNLVSAGAQIGVAKSQFYPALTLTGLAGFESASLHSALDWESRVWSIGPSLSVPIFEGGRLKANLEQARAKYNELLADYRGSVLTAIQDVEDSLNDLHMRAIEADAQDRAVKESREYVALSTTQYNQGITSYLTVIDAERTLLTNELSAAQILQQRLTSTVLLIKAVGGGWDIQKPIPTSPREEEK